MVLATEKNVPGYQRVAPAVEGNLYYWSSADPMSTPGYQQKLRDMPNAVRAHCGVWVAPVAPGSTPGASAGTASSRGATARHCAARGRPRWPPCPT